MTDAPIENLLIREWKTGARLTTIPQALARLGIPNDSRLRRRIARRLKPRWREVLLSPEKRRRLERALGRPADETRRAQWEEQVRTWQIASILLTEEEKLLARLMLLKQRRSQPVPDLRELRQALGVSPDAVRRGIRNLAWLGFLNLPDPRRLGQYTLSEGHERFLDGLGFTFHTVELQSGERFGIP
ncbi:MAG: hypothetical protein HY682_04105 [Chloroflexi bacterium]|nr:hypothetical protein [Chloroflexota bacterium]